VGEDEAAENGHGVNFVIVPKAVQDLTSRSLPGLHGQGSLAKKGLDAGIEMEEILDRFEQNLEELANLLPVAELCDRKLSIERLLNSAKLLCEGFRVFLRDERKSDPEGEKDGKKNNSVHVHYPVLLL
jgi:hypothetical protein